MKLKASNPPPPAGKKPPPPPSPPPPPTASGAGKSLELSPPAATSGAAQAAQALEARVNDFAVVAVADPAAFQAGADNLRTLKTLQDDVDAELEKITRPLNAALKAARALFAPIREKLETAERAQRKALADYKTEQDRLEAERRRKADAEARAERDRLEAEARAREAEARREAEAQREAAELERQKGNAAAAERLEAKANATETKAQATADNLLARAEAVVAAPVASAAPAAKGLANREVWHFEVRDASKIPAAFQMPDEAKIRKTVNALKLDAVAVLGGEAAVRVWSTADFSARRK